MVCLVCQRKTWKGKLHLAVIWGIVDEPESNPHLGQMGKGSHTLVPVQVNTGYKLDVSHPSPARISAEIQSCSFEVMSRSL